MITRSEKRRAVLIDLLIGIGLPIVQMATGEYRWFLFALDQVVYADVMQNTLSRGIATIFSRISGQSFRSCWYHRRFICITHGLWRSVASLSSIAVCILVHLCPLVPWLI